MASNNWLTVDWLAMTSLDDLVNKLSTVHYMDTSYSKEFKLKYPVSDTVRIPYPDGGRIRNGLVYNPDPIDRRYTTVAMQDPFGIDYELDSVERALKSPRGRENFEKNIISPKMALLAQEIDSRATQYAYRNAASVAGTLGTNPTTFDATSAAARQAMAELACPADGEERCMLVPPSLMRALKNTALTYFNPVADIAKQYRQGIIGQADGFMWYESMSLYRHTAGTWAGAVTVTATVTADGASTLGVTCTTGDTFKNGDKFAIANVLPVNPKTKRTFGATTKTFAITADTTGVASAATLTMSPAIYGPNSKNQNVDTLPVASAALTLWPGTSSPSAKVGNVALALHPKAFGMVSVEFDEPEDCEKSKTYTDEESGVSISYVRWFNGEQRKMCDRFDVQIGFGPFFNDACAVAIGCA